LGEALSDFATLQIGNSTGGTVYLMRADRDVILGYGIYDPAIHASPISTTWFWRVGCNLVAELTGGMVEPAEMLSSRARSEGPGAATGAGAVARSVSAKARPG
jgi:hypothetical protein